MTKNLASFDSCAVPEQATLNLLKRPVIRKRITDPLSGPNDSRNQLYTDTKKLSFEQLKKAFDVVYQPQVNIVCD